MKLSLSGRLLEGAPPMPTVDFIRLAAQAGYDMVELRPHQVPCDIAAPDLAAIQEALAESGVGVSMMVIGAVSGLATWLPVAEALGTTLLRVGGTAAEINAACPELRGNMRLGYQMHSASPFEEITTAAEYLQQIPDRRFGLLPEPSNLLFAGETWSPDLFTPLRGRIHGCNAQSIVLDPTAQASVKMNDGRSVHYKRVNWPENENVHLADFVASLRHAGYDDFINFIDPAMPGRDLLDYAAETARFARSLIT